MADGIVGAISLGFQVTRELAVYYSAFKSYHSDVEAVATRVELISNVFERMQATIQTLNPTQIDSLKELDRLVIACVDSLHELERYQEKCAKNKHAADHLKGHIESITKRLVYPFRKSTLEGLQRTLDSLIGIVQLMTQISHIDAGKSWNNKMLLSNDQVQRDLQTVLAQQSTHMLNLNSISNQLGSSTDLLLASHSLIRAQIGELESRIKTLADTSQSKDVVLRFPARLEVSTQNNQSMTLASKDSVIQTVSSGSFLDALQCRCSGKKYRQHYSGYGFPELFRTKFFQHPPHCPLNIGSGAVTTVGMRIRIGLLRTAYLLETGIEYGSSYIAPHIRYRNLTPRYLSPMFQILDALGVMWPGIEPISLEDLKRLLDITTKSLVAIFQQGRANISDLDEFGQNMIHAFVEVFLREHPTLDSNNSKDMLQTINSFIRVFTSLGAETSIIDDDGLTPLACFILIRRFKNDSNPLSSLSTLVETECSWIEFMRRYRHHLPSRLDALSVFKQFAISSSNSMSDSPIVMSLLQESQSDLQRHLLRRSQSENETENLELLISAIFWPKGFRLLLDHGILSNDLNHDGYSILDIALGNSAALGVVQYLLGLSMSFITPHTWQQTNRFHQERYDTGSVEMLRCVAAQLAECRQNHRLVLTNESTYPAFETMYHRLYHAYNLSVVGAQALYDNGFTHIDYNEEKLPVPLLFHLEGFRSTDKRFDLIQWFYNKRCSLRDSYSLSHTNASQILVYFITHSEYLNWNAYEIVYDSNGIVPFLCKHRSMLVDAFLDPHQDDCKCFCSLSGCEVMTFALKKGWDYYGAKESFVLKEMFILLGLYLEEHPELVQSALRLKTFDRLGMTHTCLRDHKYDRSNELSEQEKSEIHLTEDKDIAILETLLTHFESEWSNYNGTFLEFLDSHWEPHMKKVLAERRAIPIDREVLDDYGVNLIEYGPEEVPATQRPNDMYQVAWFQRVAEGIVNGREINEEDRLWY